MNLVSFVKTLFDPNQQEINRIQKIVDKIISLEPEFSKLSDSNLPKKTEELRKKIGAPSKKEFDPSSFNLQQKTPEQVKEIEEQRKKLMSVIPEAFSLVQQAVVRTYSEKRKYPSVQFIAGVALAEGKIAEMKTGEGKTQTAWLPLYLYALANKGVHLVTPNEYLAKVGAEYAGHVFSKLGLSVGVINPQESYIFVPDEKLEELKGKEAYNERMKHALLNPNDMRGWNLLKCTKREAYTADVTYGVNSEFGFDYLRDNMVNDLSEVVQGHLFYAIVDEVDSILIDEARTPLIIAGEPSSAADTYLKFAHVVSQLSEADVDIDEKAHSAVLTEDGHTKVEKLLNVDNLYDDYKIAHHLDNALKAKFLYKLDDEYIVRDKQVLIIDKFTGRVLPGRRYSQGLHQAIEAKENAEIQEETRTVATISYQNFFRLYDNLAGMTGTAITEAEEFHKIYKLDVLIIPTFKEMIRLDHPDVIFKTQDLKFRAIVEEIKEKYDTGQPVLVGTTSVEKSELLSELLQRIKIPHQVLNAKQHEKEAKIVETAGQKGSVTIATNMAGRGTDIVLGEGVVDLGGLHIIGTERHESRRIDNQLRGRSGRQGDQGSSRFFIALDDELMRIYGGEMISNLMSSMGLEDLPIESGLITRSIETAQKRVEGHNFDIRKKLVEYDDVLNQQREIIYKLRRRILSVFANEKAPVSKNILENTALTSIALKEFTDYLGKFSLNNEFSSPELLAKTNLDAIWRVWLIKKMFRFVDRIVIAQLSDDSKIDEQEEKNILNDLRYIFEEEMLTKILKNLGFSNLDEFSKHFKSLDKADEEIEELQKIIVKGYTRKVKETDTEDMQNIERILSVQAISNLWMDHLDEMDDLREGIGLRSYGQLDPLIEYKNEGFRKFDELLKNIDEMIISRLFKVQIMREAPPVRAEAVKTDYSEIAQKMYEQDQESISSEGPSGAEKNRAATKPVVNKKKIGRNDPCPCGSGKKYKKCHGRVEK